MSAVAMALDVLFADGNVGREAVYTAEGGTPVLVRVVSRSAAWHVIPSNYPAVKRE